MHTSFSTLLTLHCGGQCTYPCVSFAKNSAKCPTMPLAVFPYERHRKIVNGYRGMNLTAMTIIAPQKVTIFFLFFQLCFVKFHFKGTLGTNFWKSLILYICKRTKAVVYRCLTIQIYGLCRLFCKMVLHSIPLLYQCVY